MKTQQVTKKKFRLKHWLGTLCIVLCSVFTLTGCAIADSFNKGTITGEDSQGLKRVNTPWFNFNSSNGLFTWAFSPYSYSGENDADLIGGSSRYTYVVTGDQTSTGAPSTVVFTGDPASIQFLTYGQAYYLTPYTDSVTGTTFLKATPTEGTYQEELQKYEDYLTDPNNNQTSISIENLIQWENPTGSYLLQKQGDANFDASAEISWDDLKANAYGFEFASSTQTTTTYYNLAFANGQETYTDASVVYINSADQAYAKYFALVNSTNYDQLTLTGTDANLPSGEGSTMLQKLAYLAGYAAVDEELIEITAKEEFSVYSQQQLVSFTVSKKASTEPDAGIEESKTLVFASQEGQTYTYSYLVNDVSYTATLTKPTTTAASNPSWINVADSKYKAPSIAENKLSINLDNVLHVGKYTSGNAELDENFSMFTFVFLGNQTTNPAFVVYGNTIIACTIQEGELVLGEYSIYTTSSVFAYTQVYTQTEEGSLELKELAQLTDEDFITLTEGKTYTLNRSEDGSFTIAETTQTLGDELSVLLGELLANKNITDTKTTNVYFTWNKPSVTQRKVNVTLAADGASFENHDVMAQYATGKYSLEKTENIALDVKAFTLTLNVLTGGASNIVNTIGADAQAKIEYTFDPSNGSTDSISNYFTKAELESILSVNIANSKTSKDASSKARVLPTISVVQDGVEYIFYPVIVPTESTDNNYQLTADENTRTVNIWFLYETTVNINGVYHTVLRKASEQYIRARVDSDLDLSTTSPDGSPLDLSSLIANNMYIEFSPRLTSGSTTRNLKTRALALSGTNRANSAYSNNITYNAYKMSFTTYSPNSITIDYGELSYDANKYFFYNVNKVYDAVLQRELVTQLTGYFAEGTVVNVTRTTPSQGQTERDNAFTITDPVTLTDYLRNTYSYALQSWSVNQKALNTFASTSDLALDASFQANIVSVLNINHLRNDNVFFGVGSTAQGADVVTADPSKPYYVDLVAKQADHSSIFVRSESSIHAYNFYANYTKVDNFSLTGSVFNSEDLGGGSSTFNNEISYGLSTASLTNNLNELNEFSMVGLSLEDAIYFKGMYTSASTANLSTGYGYYFFLSDYVKAQENNIYQMPVIRTMGSISVFGDIESTGLIATKFHESTNLVVNVVAPSEEDALPNGTSYEVVKSITSAVDENGYVVTTVIISVLVPDDSMLLAYNIDTNSVGYSSTRSFADSQGNVVVINEKDGTIYGAVLTLADGTVEVLKPTQVTLTKGENDNPDTLKITNTTIGVDVVFTEIETVVSDSAIVAPVYDTGIKTMYQNSGETPLPIYVTYDVQQTKNGLYFYTAPVGEASATSGSIDFYAQELALSYTGSFENSLLNLKQYLVSGTELENYLNQSEPVDELEKAKHAFANLLGSRLIASKFYFVKPLDKAKDALLSQQIQKGNTTQTTQVLTLYTQDNNVYNGEYIFEQVYTGDYTFTLTDAKNAIMHTSKFAPNATINGGVLELSSGKGYAINLAVFGYAVAENGLVVSANGYNIFASFTDISTGETLYSTNYNAETKEFTFTYTELSDDNQLVEKTFTKSIFDPTLSVFFTYTNPETGVTSTLNNAWVLAPQKPSDVAGYLLENVKSLSLLYSSVTYTATARYYYTTTDAEGNETEHELTARITTNQIEVEEGVVVRKAVLKNEQNADIIVLGKYYVDGITARYNPTFSAWAEPETSNDANLGGEASIIGNKNGYYYLDYSSENALSSGFPGVKYLDGAPYPNPVIIFNVRHKIDEHSEISVGLLVKNVYQAELLGSFADTSSSSTFMDFTAFAFRSSQENIENSELLYSHAYVLRMQNQGFDYLYTNIKYRDENNQPLNTYIPLKIADIKVVENQDGTYSLVFVKSALAPNGSYYYQEDDVVKIRWFNGKTYEEKTTFTEQEFEELVIWSTSSNMIDNVGYQDIHTYYEGEDGRIHFTSDGSSSNPCYGLANIGAGDIHNGNTYDYSEVLFAGTATAFRSTIPGLIDKIYGDSGSMFDPNIWGYFINNMYPITISANSDTQNAPYFVTNQETVVFVASPYLQFESDSSTSGVSSQGVLYRFKQWRIFERYNESIMYRAYDQEAAYSRYLNNAIFTFAPSTSGRYLILPVYERVYQVNVGTGIVGNANDPANNNSTFTPNQGGSVTISYDSSTGNYINLDGVTKEEIERKLFFMEYLDAFKQVNLSTIQTKTFMFAKFNPSAQGNTFDVLLDSSLARFITYYEYNSISQSYNFLFAGAENTTLQSAYTVNINGENTNFQMYEVYVDEYGAYYINFNDQTIKLSSKNINSIFTCSGDDITNTTKASFDDDVLPNIHNYLSVSFVSYATIAQEGEEGLYVNTQKPVFFTVTDNMLYPTYVVKNVAEDGTATLKLTQNKQAVAKLFTKDFNFVETLLSTSYITFNNGWNQPNPDDYANGAEDPAYKAALKAYQTQVVWGTTYFDRDTQISITARPSLGYRFNNFYFAKYDETAGRYVFDASMTVNEYLVSNQNQLTYSDQIIPAHYNAHNNTYYFDKDYTQPVPESYLDAVRGLFIQTVSAAGEYFYTQVYKNPVNDMYYFDSSFTILAKVEGADVTDEMVTEKTYISAITEVVENDEATSAVVSTRYFLGGVEVYKNPEDGLFYRQISNGNYTVHNGTLTIQTLHENVAIVATFKEVYQQFIFAEPENVSGISIEDIYYYNAYGSDKNIRTDALGNIMEDPTVKGFSANDISIPLKPQAGSTEEAYTTLYEMLVKGKYTNKLFVGNQGNAVPDFAFGSYEGKHISKEAAQEQGITLANMNQFFDLDSELFVVLRVNAENKLETHSMGTNPNYEIECVVEPTEDYVTELQTGASTEKYTYYILRYTYNRAPSNPYFGYITHINRYQTIPSDMALVAGTEAEKAYYEDYDKKILKSYIASGSTNFINLSTIELFNITVSTNIVGSNASHDIVLGDFFAIAGYGNTQVLGFPDPTNLADYYAFATQYSEKFAQYLQSFDIIGSNLSSVNIYKAQNAGDVLNQYLIDGNYSYTFKNLVAARDTGMIFSAFNTQNQGATYNAETGLFEQDGKFYRFMGWYERSLLRTYVDEDGNRQEIWSDFVYQESTGGADQYSHMVIADADKEIMGIYKEVVPFAFTYNKEQVRINFSYTTDSLGNPFVEITENGLTTLSGYVDVDFEMQVQILPAGGWRYNYTTFASNGELAATYQVRSNENGLLDLTGKRTPIMETLSLQAENGSIVYDGASNMELDGYYAIGPATYNLTMQEITPISIKTNAYKEAHSITITNNILAGAFMLNGFTVTENSLVDAAQNPITYDKATNTVAFYQDANQNENVYTYNITLQQGESLQGYYVNNTTSIYEWQTQQGTTYTLPINTTTNTQGQLLFGTVSGTTEITFDFANAFAGGFITKAQISIISGSGYETVPGSGNFTTEPIVFENGTTSGSYNFNNDTVITIELFITVGTQDKIWNTTESQEVNGTNYAFTGYTDYTGAVSNANVTTLPQTLTPIFTPTIPMGGNGSTFTQAGKNFTQAFASYMAAKNAGLTLTSPTFTAMLGNNPAESGMLTYIDGKTLQVEFTYATLTVTFTDEVLRQAPDGSLCFTALPTSVAVATLVVKEGYVFNNVNNYFTPVASSSTMYSVKDVAFFNGTNFSNIFANMQFSLARTISVVSNIPELEKYIGIYVNNIKYTSLVYTGQAEIYLKVFSLDVNLANFYTFAGWYIGDTLLSTNLSFNVANVLNNYTTDLEIEARFTSFVTSQLQLEFLGFTANMQPNGTLFTLNVESGLVYLAGSLYGKGEHAITYASFTLNRATLRFTTNARFTIKGNNITHNANTYTFAGFTQDTLLAGGNTEINQGHLRVNTVGSTTAPAVTLTYLQNITFTLGKFTQNKTPITSTRVYFEAQLSHPRFTHLQQTVQIFAHGETISTYYGANLTLLAYFDNTMFAFNPSLNTSNGFTLAAEEAYSASYTKLTFESVTLNTASASIFNFTFNTFATLTFEKQENVIWQYQDIAGEGWKFIPQNGNLDISNFATINIRVSLTNPNLVTNLLRGIMVNGTFMSIENAVRTEENGTVYYTFVNIPVTHAYISAVVVPTYQILVERYINGELQPSTLLPLFLAHTQVDTETVAGMVDAQATYFAPVGNPIYLVAAQNNAYLFAGYTVYSMQGEVLDVIPADTTTDSITFTPTEPCIVKANYYTLYPISTFTETRGSFTNTQVGGTITTSVMYNQAIQNTTFTIKAQANAGFMWQGVILTYQVNNETITKVFTPNSFGTGEFTINDGNGNFDIPFAATGITFTAIFAQERNVTLQIQFNNASSGSITYQGQTLTSGQTLTLGYNEAVTFMAQAQNGSVFAGWFLDEYTPISYNNNLSFLATEIWQQTAQNAQEINLIAKFDTSLPSYNSHTSMRVGVLQADGSIVYQDNVADWLTQNENTFTQKQVQGYTFIGWYQEIRTHISNYMGVSNETTYTLPTENKGEVLMVAMFAQEKQTAQTFTYETGTQTIVWKGSVGYILQTGNVTRPGNQTGIVANVELPAETNTHLTITNHNGTFLPEVQTNPNAPSAGITLLFTETTYTLTVEVVLPDGSQATPEQIEEWLLGNGSGVYAQNSSMFVGISLEGTNYLLSYITTNPELSVSANQTFAFTLTQDTTITFVLKDIPKVENPGDGTEIVDGKMHHFTFTAPIYSYITHVTIGENTYTIEEFAGVAGLQNVSITKGYETYANVFTGVGSALDPETMVTSIAFSISEDDFANTTSSITTQSFIQLEVSSSLQNDISRIYFLPKTTTLNVTPWLEQEIYAGISFATYVNQQLQEDITNITLAENATVVRVYLEEIVTYTYEITLEGEEPDVTLPNESLLSINGTTYANGENISLSTGTFYAIGLASSYVSGYALVSMRYINAQGEEVTVTFTQNENNLWAFPADGIQEGSTLTFTIGLQKNSFTINLPFTFDVLKAQFGIQDANGLAALLFAGQTEKLANITFTVQNTSNGCALVGTYAATLIDTLTLHALENDSLKFIDKAYEYISTQTKDNVVDTNADVPISLNSFNQTYTLQYRELYALYLATNRETLDSNIQIQLQYNNQKPNPISLADFLPEENGYYVTYIPKNAVVTLTFTNQNGNLTNLKLFEITMKTVTTSNIADFLAMYQEANRQIQNEAYLETYYRKGVQLNGNTAESSTCNGSFVLSTPSVYFLDFANMQESVPEGLFIHGGVGSVITPDPDATMHPNFSSNFDGGYYNFTTNGNYTVDSENGSLYYIDTTTGLVQRVNDTVFVPTDTQNGGEVNVATNKKQEITFAANLFGSTNKLVYKDTKEEVLYAERITLFTKDGKLYVKQNDKQREVVVASSRSAITNLSTYNVKVNNQILTNANTTQIFTVGQNVTLSTTAQNNYRFVGFMVHLTDGTIIPLDFEQNMVNEVLTYTASFTVFGSVKQIEILYEGQISKIDLRQIEISQESFDANGDETSYALSYNGKTPQYAGPFENLLTLQTQAVNNKGTYLLGNLQNVPYTGETEKFDLWQNVLKNTLGADFAKLTAYNNIVMAYFDGTTVQVYYFTNLYINEEGIVDLQWAVISYLVNTQTENTSFDLMNSYLGYTKGSLLVRETATLSSYPYAYGKHIGWSLANGLTQDNVIADLTIPAYDVKTDKTYTLTNQIDTQLGNTVTFTIPQSLTLFTYFTTMRYLVTVDFADMENVTNSTYDSNNTNFLVFDTSNEKYAEFFANYYEVFGDYKVRIDNGNSIFAPSAAANTIQLVRESWLDKTLSKTNNQLVMSKKFAGDYFGSTESQYALRVPSLITNTTNLQKIGDSAVYAYDMIDWGMYGADKNLSNFLQYYTTDDNGNLVLKPNLVNITYNGAPLTNYTLQANQNTNAEVNANATGTITLKFYIYADTGTGFGRLVVQGNPLLDSAYEIRDTVITYDDGSQKTFKGSNENATGNIIVKDPSCNMAEQATQDLITSNNTAEGFNQWIYNNMTYDEQGNPTKEVEAQNVTITFLQCAKSSNVNASVNLGGSNHTFQLLGNVTGSNNMKDYTVNDYANTFLKLLQSGNLNLLNRVFGNDWKTLQHSGMPNVGANGEVTANNSSLYSNYDITILKNAEYHAQTINMWMRQYMQNKNPIAELYTLMYSFLLSTPITSLYYQEGSGDDVKDYSIRTNFEDYVKNLLNERPLTSQNKFSSLYIDKNSLVMVNGNPIYFEGTITIPNIYNPTTNNFQGNAQTLLAALNNDEYAGDYTSLWESTFVGKLEIPIQFINVQSLYADYFMQSGGAGVVNNNELLRLLLTMNNSISLFDQVIINTEYNEQYQLQKNTPEANTEAEQKDKWFPSFTFEDGLQYRPSTAVKAYSYLFPGGLQVRTTSQEHTLIARSEITTTLDDNPNIIENFADVTRNAFAFAFPIMASIAENKTMQDFERSIVDFTTENVYNTIIRGNFTLFNLQSISYSDLFNSGGVGLDILSSCQYYQSGNTKSTYDNLLVTKIYEYNPVPWSVYWVAQTLFVVELVYDIASIAVGVGLVSAAGKALAKKVVREAGESALKYAAKKIGKKLFKGAAKFGVKLAVSSLVVLQMAAMRATVKAIYALALKSPFELYNDPVGNVKGKNPVYMDDIILVNGGNVPNYSV